MVGESLAIIAVIVVLAAMLARRGTGFFAAVTLPLISVPLFHLIGTVVLRRRYVLACEIAGLVVGLVLCYLFSRALPQKRSRWGYLLFCWTFTVALAVAYFMYLF